MTEPLFPRFINRGPSATPRSRLTFPMLLDVLTILTGIIVLVTPGYPTWLYAAWLAGSGLCAIALNLEVRQAMRGLA